MQTPGNSEHATPLSPRAEDWFRRAFDEFYLDLYAHRSPAEAARLIRTLRRRFGLRGPVLDVACGAGRFLQVLASEGERAVGIDLSWPLLDRARATLHASLPDSGTAPPTRDRPRTSLDRSGLSDRLHPSLDRRLPSLVRADMRRLPIRSASHAWALLLFTSFGYFDTSAEDAEVLREIARALVPGGGFALDYLNASEAVRSLVPESTREHGGRSVRESRRFDPAGPFLRKRVEVGGGADGAEPSVWEERVRLYSREELEGLADAAGLRTIATLGDYDGSAFDESRSSRCLLIARKESTP